MTDIPRQQQVLQAKPGWWNALKRWVLGEWRSVKVNGILVGQVKSRAREVVVDVESGVIVA